MAERGLTAGERAILSSVFGSSINLDAVRITSDRAISAQSEMGSELNFARTALERYSAAPKYAGLI
jgi:hypothetical protein